MLTHSLAYFTTIKKLKKFRWSRIARGGGGTLIHTHVRFLKFSYIFYLKMCVHIMVNFVASWCMLSNQRSFSILQFWTEIMEPICDIYSLHYLQPKTINHLNRVVFPKHMFYGGPLGPGVTALWSSSPLFVALQNSTSFFFSAPTLQYTSLHHQAPTIFCLALQRSKQFQINKGSSV